MVLIMTQLCSASHPVWKRGSSDAYAVQNELFLDCLSMRTCSPAGSGTGYRRCFGRVSLQNIKRLLSGVSGAKRAVDQDGAFCHIKPCSLSRGPVMIDFLEGECALMWQ